ncbi:MAG: thiamine-phosphate kinase [Pseudomonadota bacterium]
MGEFGLIERFFSRAGGDAELGVGDDAAIIATTSRTAVAVDTLVSGVHFPQDTPAAAIGHRALAVNLSDLAAIGASPRWFTLALTLPTLDEAWLGAFAEAMLKLAQQFGVSLVGGDTTRGPLSVTVQVIGEAPEVALLRAGARAGDSVYVGGYLGDAAGGLYCLLHDQPEGAQRLIDAFHYPQPQLALSQRLLGVASATIDVSDGLLADVGHIARASRCDVDIQRDLLPCSSTLRRLFAPSQVSAFALSGGDDYVLCFTAANPDLAEELDGITRVGQCVAGTGAVRVDGMTVDNGGYEHFNSR